MFLTGLAIEYYRGISGNIQYLKKFSKFNFFIGANNSGKSTILNFMTLYLPTEKRKGGLNVLEFEKYRGTVSGVTRFAIGVTLGDFFENLHKIRNDSHTRVYQTFEEGLRALYPDGIIWLEINTGSHYQSDTLKLYRKEPLDIYNAIGRDFAEEIGISQGIYSRGTGGKEACEMFLNKYLNAQEINIEPITLIPAKRQIGPKGEELKDFSGVGLIDKLAELQSPGYDRQTDREIFKKINLFLRNVTDSNDATIEVPHHRDHILVHMNNKVLPLSSLGTGIHEVVMLASFCTLYENQVICIEEPEIHLHPVLQKKFIRYLEKNTSNQYFIATHSASFIDTPGSSIFHVKNDGSETTITEVLLRSESRKICDELGYKASDIIQSNAVIWVEGPSDRTYLRHWIEAKDDKLVEGIHYSIMFYGGRLLSHLDADQNDIEDLIALRSLNQNLAIVIDSDKESAGRHLNATKKRIRDQFDNSAGYCWVTQGREIENYVDPDLLHQILKGMYPNKYVNRSNTDRFSHALYFEEKRGKKSQDNSIFKNADKVTVAKKVCENVADFSILDLDEKVSSLVKFIRSSNLHSSI